MLEAFCAKFYEWQYTEFSKLDKYIRQVFKEIFMIKRIYMDKPSGHIYQYLANLVTNEQLLIWDKNDLRKYKKMYWTSKAWLLLEFKFDFPVSQQLRPSIEAKTNPINS